MKNNTNKTVAQMCNSTKTPSTLFDSILLAENQAIADAEVHKYASRVAMVLKVINSRGLDTIRFSFIDQLSRLVQDTANAIDDELSKAQED